MWEETRLTGWQRHGDWAIWCLAHTADEKLFECVAYVPREAS